MLKLQGAPNGVCTTEGANTTSPAKEIVMPSQRTTAEPCPVCSTPVYATEARRATGRGKYCSHRCRAIGITAPRVERACEQCRVAFELYASDAARRPASFCSEACRRAFRKAQSPGGAGIVRRSRERNRAHVAQVNARTVCAHCGAQPIEWHNSDHVLLNRQDWRIGNLVWQPAAIAKIEEEMARCTPLCRRCHMAEDGRFKNLKQNSGGCGYVWEVKP